MSDQGTHFIDKTIEALIEEFAVHHQKENTLPSIREWDSGRFQQDLGDNTNEDLQSRGPQVLRHGVPRAGLT